MSHACLIKLCQEWGTTILVSEHPVTLNSTLKFDETIELKVIALQHNKWKRKAIS